MAKKLCNTVPGVLLIWEIVGQGPTVLAVGAGGDCLDIFPFHLWKTKCLKGLLYVNWLPEWAVGPWRH